MGQGYVFLLRLFKVVYPCCVVIMQGSRSPFPNPLRVRELISCHIRERFPHSTVPFNHIGWPLSSCSLSSIYQQVGKRTAFPHRAPTISWYLHNLTLNVGYVGIPQFPSGLSHSLAAFIRCLKIVNQKGSRLNKFPCWLCRLVGQLGTFDLQFLREGKKLQDGLHASRKTSRNFIKGLGDEK